ncbi:MAG: hypothetical protein ACFFCW_48545 [Candidatus Hodarchaeota archaeon]
MTERPELRDDYGGIRPRRLYASGASRISRLGSRFWKRLGYELASEDNLTLITGGLKRRLDFPETFAGDWMIVRGALDAEKEGRQAKSFAIETLLPGRDWDLAERFHINDKVLHGKNLAARRFKMVSSADVVVSYGGAVGTRSVLDLAFALERPTLPIPFSGGRSAKVWRRYRDTICEWFSLTQKEARELESVRLSSLSDRRLKRVAKLTKKYLLRGFVKRCFVIMPFEGSREIAYDRLVLPGLQSEWLEEQRTDRAGLPEDVVDTIHKMIQSCDGAVADITGANSNVMYEVGFALASRKPVLLLHERPLRRRDRPIPFDIRNRNILTYPADRPERVLGAFRKQLKKTFGPSS